MAVGVRPTAHTIGYGEPAGRRTARAAARPASGLAALGESPGWCASAWRGLLDDTRMCGHVRCITGAPRCANLLWTDLGSECPLQRPASHRVMQRDSRPPPGNMAVLPPPRPIRTAHATFTARRSSITNVLERTRSSDRNERTSQGPGIFAGKMPLAACSTRLPIVNMSSVQVWQGVSPCDTRGKSAPVRVRATTCGSRKPVATVHWQISAQVITPLAAHSDDATHPLLGLPRSVQAPAVGPAAAQDNPYPTPGACANGGNTGSTRSRAA